MDAHWYKYWSSRGHFEPPSKWSSQGKPPVRMLLPPPNVTGELHIGHALMIAIEDALARYYRMKGNPVVWAPGTDHAGIATQMVVERMLASQRGVTRQELGREKFVQEVEEWRETYGSRILEQMRVLGASTTNSREYYTKDEGLSKAVSAAFVRLWEERLIYRDTRMVNWSTVLQTAVSDIEVVTQDIQGTAPKKVGGFVQRLSSDRLCSEVLMMAERGSESCTSSRLSLRKETARLWYRPRGQKQFQEIARWRFTPMIRGIRYPLFCYHSRRTNSARTFTTKKFCTPLSPD
jgi:methionyl-tRNA synthetase